jgi:hypothetical protein
MVRDHLHKVGVAVNLNQDRKIIMMKMIMMTLTTLKKTKVMMEKIN